MSTTPPASTAVRTGTVFIVDDEMMVTSSLQTMLGLETSHAIHCFNSPLEALAQVETLSPDVVISDFSMPGMDGISFLRKVKALLPESTLILLTGYADKENAIQAINTVGIYRYIEKPWDNEELKISINNGLERSHLVGDLRCSIEELTKARAALEVTNYRLESMVEERTRDLRETYRKLQSIVNNTADGILTLDASLAVSSINPAAERWLRSVPELAAAELATLPLEQLLSTTPAHGTGGPSGPAALAASKNALLKLFEPNQPVHVAEVFIGDLPLEASIAPLSAPLPPAMAGNPVASGKASLHFAVDASALVSTSVPDAEGATGGFVVVMRDITARKEIERLRDDFVSTLTHDLRTPLLAAIQTLGFFTDGSLGELPPKQAELIRMLINSLREMLGLVNVLLEVYKYESGRQKLIFDTVDLEELVGGVCRELDALAQNREQMLSIDVEKACAFKVRGDKQELKRVLVNLVGNAINFTPVGGEIRASLSLDARTGPSKRISVCVSDTGRGIPAQDIPLLFQRFSQGTSKQRSSGSGLGLYLSRQIIEAHHGHIWVESEEGHGSRFYFTLPLLG